MSNRPKIEAAHAQVANLLAKELRAGTWVKNLPGIKSLAARYRVNHKTVARALMVLEHQGIIKPAEPRKPRQISTESMPSGSKIQNLLILFPEGDIDGGENILFRQQLAHRWSERFGNYSMIPIKGALTRTPAKVMDRLIHEHDGHAIVLCNMPLHWGEVALEKLPVYFAGGFVPENKMVSCFGLSIKAELAKAYRILKELGHQRILFVYDEISPEMKDLILAIPESPKSSDSLVGRPEDYCIQTPPLEPEAWDRMWKLELGRLKATAVITSAAVGIISLYSFCQLARKRIPEDYSILSIEHVKELEWLIPRPQQLRFDHEAHMRHFNRWMRGGLQPLGKKTIALEWDEKARSIGKAKN